MGKRKTPQRNRGDFPSETNILESHCKERKAMHRVSDFGSGKASARND